MGNWGLEDNGSDIEVKKKFLKPRKNIWNDIFSVHKYNFQEMGWCSDSQV